MRRDFKAGDEVVCVANKVTYTDAGQTREVKYSLEVGKTYYLVGVDDSSKHCTITKGTGHSMSVPTDLFLYLNSIQNININALSDSLGKSGIELLFCINDKQATYPSVELDNVYSAVKSTWDNYLSGTVDDIALVRNGDIWWYPGYKFATEKTASVAAVIESFY